MKINRKRLNNKGFTLVELLAVIVILALVMGIAASYMISTMNQSRSATLYSAAQNAAATLNAWMADDLLVGDTQKQLGSTFTNVYGPTSKGWVCITSTQAINAKGNSNVTLLGALGIDAKDIELGDDDHESPGDATSGATSGTDDTSSCSAIRYNAVTNGYEVLLVAKSTGKYYNNSAAEGKNYAYSRASGPSEELAS